MKTLCHTIAGIGDVYHKAITLSLVIDGDRAYSGMTRSILQKNLKGWYFDEDE